MSNQVIAKIEDINIELNELEIKKDLPQAQRTVASIVRLLDDSISIDDQSLFQLFTDSDGKIRANASWFYQDSVMTDRKATYAVHPKNNLNIDFKFFGINKLSRRMISWAQLLTPNFEDEPFNKNYNIGIDFIVPKSADRIIIVLSNNWVIRTIELKKKLTATFQEILARWANIKNFDNKTEFHNILWDSFDLQPLNEKFYLGIRKHFSSLRQHLVKGEVFDEKHTSMFVNRLLGRIIFCWFLDKKDIINHQLKYFDSESFDDDNEYYKTKLEKLFFEVLNKPIEDRVFKDTLTPFLNGGLFEIRENDLVNNSKLSFPRNYFDELFKFLREYNFTTDESTSQYQQVAIDPEMLGRVFENLLAEEVEETGEQARKAKGAFYTPREVVDYMCKESLKQYLKTKVEEDEHLDRRLWQLIDAPDKEFQDQDHNWRRDWKPYKSDILSALDELKFLDPACGSGAFPIGMLQLLVNVYERLESRFDSYKTKLNIIQKNIYGIDIMPMAVEIARLRAWLSIIVDEESSSKKIKPLPNLEFKFICANSLLDLDKSENYTLGIDPNLQENLGSIRDAYFNTKSLNKKKKLRNNYENLVNQKEVFGDSKRSRQLKTYRPFDNESQAEFFDPKFMFGVEKFNLIIANPPYTGEKNHKDIFRRIRESALGQRFGIGKMDLFYYFFHFALDYLDKNGVGAFITTNYFITATGAKKLKDDLKNRSNILRLINFNELKIFKSALGQHNMITLFCNTINNTTAKTYVTKRKGLVNADILKDILSEADEMTDYYQVAQKDLYFQGNIQLTQKEIDSVLNKINDIDLRLGRYSKIPQGLKTNSDSYTDKHKKKYSIPDAEVGDGIFIISEQEKVDLNLNSEELKLLKPIYKNTDIENYFVSQQPKKYVLFITKENYVDKGKHPNIIKHLDKYRDVLLDRAEVEPNGRIPIYSITRPRDKEMYDKEKIVAPYRTTQGNVFGYDDKSWYASGDVFFIKDLEDYSYKFLVAILNSSLIYCWLKNRGKRKGAIFELYTEPLLKIPLPNLSKLDISEIKEIEDLVDKLLSYRESENEDLIKEIKEEIDVKVMNAYRLSKKDQEIVWLEKNSD